jgi:glycerophosphoryl diester phosphodiesterase
MLTAIIILLIIAALLCLLFVLALRGRTRHSLLRKLRKWKYAHRGLHGNGVPENSLWAFRKAVEHGYGSELDIHLLADGNLAVIHDSSLKRTAGADIAIESLSTGDLKNYFLEGTQETIPTLQEVLDVYDGKAPLIIELKSEGGNYNALTETACKALESYKGLYCFESFDPRCIRWLKVNRPDIVRGQLAHNSLRDKPGTVPLIIRFLMTNLISNFWNSPDFIAYNFLDRNWLSVQISRKFWKIQGVSWTLRNPDDFKTAVEEDWIPIFEGFEP